jgi:uncharacterized lipoprotein
MNNISKAIFAVLMVLGLAACSSTTSKEEPAPAAPEPAYEPKPDRG